MDGVDFPSARHMLRFTRLHFKIQRGLGDHLERVLFGGAFVRMMQVVGHLAGVFEMGMSTADESNSTAGLVRSFAWNAESFLMGRGRVGRECQNGCLESRGICVRREGSSR